jgi:hypothetical protein
MPPRCHQIHACICHISNSLLVAASLQHIAARHPLSRLSTDGPTMHQCGPDGAATGEAVG